MTSTSSNTSPRYLDPLHFLASVVSRIDCDVASPMLSPSTENSAGSASPSSSSTRSLSSAPTSTYMNDVASLHIPYKSPQSPREVGHRALRHLNTSNRAQISEVAFVPFMRQKSGRRTRKTTELHLKGRLQMKTKREGLLEKAKKITSLDNSPVNERQLQVLRMVYDEITMYPCESWMVLLAIVLNRAYKQVKNWFSNERQKNREGESISVETEDGDKVRLRSSALLMCQHWSDSFFEEVVMIYNYRVQRNSRFRGSLRQPDDVCADRDPSIMP